MDSASKSKKRKRTPGKGKQDKRAREEVQDLEEDSQVGLFLTPDLDIVMSVDESDTLNMLPIDSPEAALPIASTSSDPNLVLGWNPEDLNTLIANIHKFLPKNDHAKFSTAVEKFDWNKIAFNDYTAAQCKEKWLEITGRLRRYRTLTDLVGDAKLWVKQPWSSFSHAGKTQLKHPDLPKKPLTPFFRYFLEKREKLAESNQGSSVTDLAKLLSVKFAKLSDKKRKKLKTQYDVEYEAYKEKLQQFKLDHPDLIKNQPQKENYHGKNAEGPAKPKTPYTLFLEDKLKKDNVPDDKKKEIVDNIKTQWNNLSEGKKIKWIRRAITDEQRYNEELEEYKKDHPTFNPPPKTVLNKFEKQLKARFDGKPDKPPNSGYSLFSKIMLRELKDVPSKDKMGMIGKRWKELPDNKKEEYNKDAQKQASKYVEKFEAYLNSLPEEERANAMSENKVKLPSQKKLLQKQQLQLQQHEESSGNEAPVDDLVNDQKLNRDALIIYQSERLPALQAKHPTKSAIEIFKLIDTEWHEKLNIKKKGKYYKLAQTQVKG